MVSKRLQDNRTALAAVPQQREPEIGTFARPPDCSPKASDEREVQENDCVGSTNPDFDSVIRPEVAIHDPCVVLNKPLLYFHPLIAGCGDQARLPEHLVQFYHRQPRDLSQMHCEG